MYVSIEGQGHFLTLAQGHLHMKIKTGLSQSVCLNVKSVRKSFNGENLQELTELTEYLC